MTLDYYDIFREFIERRRTVRALVIKGANLHGLRLMELRADGLELEEADLREASLKEVRWKACILCEAHLDAADFTDAILRLCDLDRARATNATFLRTRLENSTARGVLFDGANFLGAVLTDTDFSRASFRGANLESVSASGANFRGADLNGANLRNAELVDTDLRGADLTDADLKGAILDGADLRGAIGVEDLREEPATEALPEELKPLISTVAPMVDEMLRSAGQTGFLDPEAAEQLQKQMDDIQQVHPSRSIHPDTLQAVSEVIGSLGDDAFPTLLKSLSQPGGGDPPPEIQALIQRLGQALNLGDGASPDEILSKLVDMDTESSKNLDPKPDP
ncbi:pentapeptide repeat-containing protein [Mastigocoleus sp. MO_188.B34]|uniref:pentapeptide repeat-containing protein n=1 Tax=Mastigocoleus sp. MO_188.B34 TaxID=3036635 RepID=UPI0026045625|nr:pentapeptide repeat-containing protein [Mastigocoleus sp. MO_188.B34]MDJ0694547.1 pentapeptide repeat-containing protein [Mastigocoleus sp. MO_188.B34]